MGKLKEENTYIPKKDEEIRCGFKITSNRKKVRNIELGLLDELKRICKKHNLTYFTSGGTMLGAIRHKGFIPWDDDMDIVMFREDYERLQEIAGKELPKNIKLSKYYLGFSKLRNTNTAALGDDNWRDEDYIGGIRIDIFPVDYASKFKIINRVKSSLLLFLRAILLSQKTNSFASKVKKRQIYFIYFFKFIFKKIDGSKVYNLHEKISKKVFFKGDNIYTGWCPYIYYPKNIFDKGHDVEFENTTIFVPNGYDTYLKIAYGEYLKPVIWEGGHKCRFSTDKSYKDIIKKFDKTKSNEENYSNCKELFTL